MDLIQEINSGLESLGLAEAAAEDAEFQDRLQTLQDRMQTIEETGLVSRDQVQQLIVSGVELNERRYPLTSFTIEPSPVGVRPALEAAEGEQKNLFQKMLNAATEAFKRVVAWIMEKAKKIKDFLLSAQGKKKAADAQAAELKLTQVNSLSSGISAAISKFNGVAISKGEQGKAAAAEVTALWDSWLEKDQERANRIITNRLLNSSLISDAQLRADFTAALTSFRTVVRHVIQISGNVENKLRSLHLGNASPEERKAKVDELQQYIDKAVQHPFTTNLYRKYGDGSVEHPTVVDGYQALIKHIYASQPMSDQEAADWRDLTKGMAALVHDLKPANWSAAHASGSIDKLDATAVTQTAAATVINWLSEDPNVRALAKNVISFQEMINGMYTAMFRTEALMVTLIMDLGGVVHDRVHQFSSVAFSIGLVYKKAGLQNEWDAVSNKFYADMTALAN